MVADRCAAQITHHKKMLTRYGKENMELTVNQHPQCDSVAVEGLPVHCKGVGLACKPRCVVPVSLLTELLLCCFSEGSWA